ncbi:MAG: ABC transporter substrate-binding protein [Solirubrobacteraceae bacterium]
MSTLKRLTACAAIAACAVAFGGVGGCAGQGSTTPKVSGSTLTIYLSAPSGSVSSENHDVTSAAQLAFAHGPHSTSHFQFQLQVLHASESDNARTAIQDTSAIAYIGEVPPGSSAGTVGITNAEDLLQVSPTDTALELTNSTPAVPRAPNDYYESLKSYGRTFGRVVPTTAAEARAQVSEMRSLGIHKVYVADDGSPYGRAIAYAVKQNASGPITAVPGPPVASRVGSAGADAVFFGGSSTSTARAFFDSVASSDPHTKLLAPSALYAESFVQGLSPAARGRLYVSSPGFLPHDLPATAKSDFVAPFVATYHHQPPPQAIFGYEAVSAVLATLDKAGSSADERSTVVRDFMNLHRSSSVLGSYSIDRYGGPTIAPFVFARVRGTALQPYRFEQANG